MRRPRGAEEARLAPSPQQHVMGLECRGRSWEPPGITPAATAYCAAALGGPCRTSDRLTATDVIIGVAVPSNCLSYRERKNLPLDPMRFPRASSP